MINELLDKLMPIHYSLTGSLYIESPPKFGTDIDVLILVNSLDTHTISVIEKSGWKCCGNDNSKYAEERKIDPSTNWDAFRKGEYNIIITDDIGYYIRFMAATELLKKFNVKDKDLRIDVMRAVKFSKDADMELMELFSQ